MKKLVIIATMLLSAAFASIAAEPETQYRGNADSKTFHKSSCRYFSNTNCTAVFSAPDAAVKAGYSSCKVCKP